MTSFRLLVMSLCAALLVFTLPAAAESDGHGGIVVSSDYVELPMLQGWYDGTPVWYVFIGSNDIDYVRTLSTPYTPWIKKKNGELDYMLYPKLKSALQGGASPVYMVTNFQQGPVFSALPGQPDYSALWQVHLVTWKDGVEPRPIVSADNLPPPEEAEITPVEVVLDLPIMIVGPLGSVARAIEYNAPAPDGTYYNPQIIKIVPARLSASSAKAGSLEERGEVSVNGGVFSPYPLVLLPTWPAYAQDPIKRKIAVVPVIITDAADPQLAYHLQTNLAPALDLVDDANTETVWYFRKGQDPPIPLSQYLVLEHAATVAWDFNVITVVPVNSIPVVVYKWMRYWGYNTNYDASPVMNLQPLVRGTIPDYAVVNNPTLLKLMLQRGLLLESGPSMRVNVAMAPIPPVKIRQIVR